MAVMVGTEVMFLEFSCSEDCDSGQRLWGNRVNQIRELGVTVGSLLRHQRVLVLVMIC